MQPFVLYNSEQRKKVEFVPRKEGHIDMYVTTSSVFYVAKVGMLNTFVISPILTIKLLNVPMKMVKVLQL